MNNNNELTRINEGNLHENNPNGGVLLGNNNSVEEGETLKKDFVYSNRLFLDENLVKQFNLPKSLIGKSVADATKIIDNKFEGRNDKISQSTKNLMLDKIGQAQESLKPQEIQAQEGMGEYPEELQQDEMQSEAQEGSHIMPDGATMQGQMAYGGYRRQMYNGGFKTSQFEAGLQEDATAEQVAGTSAAGLGALTTAFDLGNTAFGKASQDIQGLSASERVGGAGMIGGSALKGASAGAAFGPIGAGVGAVIGGAAGLIGLGKARKAETLNTKRLAANTNNQFSDQYALGGELNQIDPPINSNMIKQDSPYQTKKIVKYQPGVSNDKLGGGFYLYSKDNLDPTFNHKTDREFVENSSMDIVQKTAQWQEFMRNKQMQPKQFFNGGKMKPPIALHDLKSAGLATSSMPLSNISALSSNTINDQLSNVPYRMTINDHIKENLMKAGKFVNENIGKAARYTPIAMNAYQLSQLKKPAGERLDRLLNRYNPEYVDEMQLQNIADQNMNNSINSISQSGASQGQMRSSILGAQLQRTRGLSEAYGQAAAQNRVTNDRAQTFNIGVDQTNLQQSNAENDINARNQAAYRNTKREYLTGIGEGIGDIGKEETFKKIAKNTTGYRFDGTYVKDASGNIVTDAQTGRPMTEEKLKESQSAEKTTKKALGGYLIKNRK